MEWKYKIRQSVEVRRQSCKYLNIYKFTVDAYLFSY